jgi:hypothetical protein
MTVRRFAPLLLLGLIACRDAGAPSAELVPLLEIIDGNGQVDTVAKQLPIAITARAEDKLSAQPARGVVLNWFRVVGADSVFLGAALTNDSGIARLRPTLATKAGPQAFVAWALDADGQRSEYAAAAATALPDRARWISVPVDSTRIWLGDPVRARDFASAWDQFYNFVGTPVFGPAVGWTVRADTAWASEESRVELPLLYDALRSQLRVTALRDLRRHQWSLVYRCRGLPPLVVPDHDAWTVEWVELRGVTDSVTPMGPDTPGAAFELWSTSTFIRGLYQWRLDGTELRRVDTTTARTRLRVVGQDVGRIVPASLETRPGRWVPSAYAFDSVGAVALWNGTAYAGGDLRLCQRGGFDDYPAYYSAASTTFEFLLEELP